MEKKQRADLDFDREDETFAQWRERFEADRARERQMRLAGVLELSAKRWLRAGRRGEVLELSLHEITSEGPKLLGAIPIPRNRLLDIWTWLAGQMQREEQLASEIDSTPQQP